MDVLNRKQFFVEFAANKGFDPFVAQNWYSVSAKEILNSKVSKKKLK